MIQPEIKQIMKYFPASVFLFLLLAGCTNSDPNKPDTRANIRGFERIVNVPKSDDVKDIYFFADEFGFDPTYQFSFTCDISTIKKIVAAHKLNRITGKEVNPHFGTGQEFKWWNKEKVEALNLHWNRYDSIAYKVVDVWYDEKNSKGYFVSIKL